MQIVTTTEQLKRLCGGFARAPYVTVDTEFLRETTFWPELCLVQMASPDEAAIIDPLAPGIELTPLFELMADEKVVKVFHAARQDIEIIYNLAGLIPHPVFDTQVAAMVCGYGDSISYDQLVFRITAERVDKSSRFTDWKRRPLSAKQLEYALSDVTHLRQVYQSIKANLEEQGRAHWVSEEMEILTSPETYDMPPANAWQRLKLRVRKPRDFALLKALAEWREIMARTHNVPRGRVIKDEAIYEICGHPPRSTADLMALRGLSRGFDRNRYGNELLAVVRQVLETPKASLPGVPSVPQKSFDGSGATTEMLKVLLKLIVEKHGVAAKIVATVEDLERIADDDEADVPALKGWRRELFGEAALKLKNGRIALGCNGRSVQLIAIEDCAKAAPIAAE
ncbi:MAG: ribonuclease D [Alphaproteobacteria bacterium]|nr:MAG: ribonuclease D [Alphaproteobacteria bacterium]